MVLRVNNGKFPKQHRPAGLCSRCNALPVRYRLNSCIFFGRNSFFKGLSTAHVPSLGVGKLKAGKAIPVQAVKVLEVVRG
jgi:hypothetical protein